MIIMMIRRHNEGGGGSSRQKGIDQASTARSLHTTDLHNAKTAAELTPAPSERCWAPMPMAACGRSKRVNLFLSEWISFSPPVQRHGDKFVGHSCRLLLEGALESQLVPFRVHLIQL